MFVEAIHAVLENDALLIVVCVSFVALIVMTIDLIKERHARQAMDHKVHTYVDKYLDTLSFLSIKK